MDNDLKQAIDDIIAETASTNGVMESGVKVIQGLTGQNATLIQELADAQAANDPVGVADAIQRLKDANAAQAQAANDLAAAIPQTPAS